MHTEYTHKNRDLGDANEIRLYQKVLRLQTLVSLKRLKRVKFWESDSAGGNEFHTGVKKHVPCTKPAIFVVIFNNICLLTYKIKVQTVKDVRNGLSRYRNLIQGVQVSK